MSTTLSGNHESLKSKIRKRRKARSNTPLSCKIEYYFKTNSACFSGQSAFFTDDHRTFMARGRATVPPTDDCHHRRKRRPDLLHCSGRGSADLIGRSRNAASSNGG